jgi:hypothetical protein
MTPDAEQPRDGYLRPPSSKGPTGGATVRSAAGRTEAAPGGHPDGIAHPAPPADQADPAHPPRAAPQRAAEDASIVGVIPALAILVVAVAGVYVAWRQGSSGAGEGGVIGGAALLAGAVVRLLLPVRLAGLLAVRKRVTDAVTLAVFGAGLLIAGLVLPR